MMRITQATDEQYKAFYGVDRERNIVAYAVQLNGVVTAMFGAIVKRDYAVLFSDIVGEHPRLRVWRGAAIAMQYLRLINKPLIAHTDTSGRFLESIGFYREGEHYRYANY